MTPTPESYQAADVVIRINVSDLAKKYRRLADNYERQRDAYESALSGGRFSRSDIQEKCIELGILIGQAAVYKAIAGQFENLVKIHGPEQA